MNQKYLEQIRACRTPLFGRKSRQTDMVTYGNAIYDFCLFRSRIQQFRVKQSLLRKLNFMLGITFEVFRAVNKHSELPWMEEFYRESYYKAF